MDIEQSEASQPRWDAVWKNAVAARDLVDPDRRDFYELAPDFFARVIRARVARWRRIQQLVDDVRSDAQALSGAARARFDAVESIQSAVIDRVDDALAEWENSAQKRRAAARAKRQTA